MTRRIALLFSIAALVFGGAAVAPATDSFTLTPEALAKPCSSRYTHGIIGGEHKCLRPNQYCARRYDSQYHRYGFHCHRYYRGGYRLA